MDQEDNEVNILTFLEGGKDLLTAAEIDAAYGTTDTEKLNRRFMTMVNNKKARRFNT